MTMRSPYKWQVGEVVDFPSYQVQILEHRLQESSAGGNKKSHKKSYLYQCIKCGWIDERLEYHMDKLQCPVCSGRKTKWNYNSIAWKHPEMISWFANIEDAYNNSIGSHSKVEFICPKCGQNVGKKVIKNVINNGISCPYCGDGIPIGERIFQTACDLAHIKYKRQATFDWSEKYIYDFYLYDLNYIVEIDGQQHYSSGSSFESVSSLTYEEQKKIDEYKEELAYKNGIKEVLHICAYSSNFDKIRCAIQGCIWLCLNTDIYNIDWNECERISAHSMVHVCAEEWNKGHDATYIVNKYSYCGSSVNNWLTQAQKIGLTKDYSKKNADYRRGRKIINTRTLECYWSTRYLADILNTEFSIIYSQAYHKKNNIMFYEEYVKDNNISDAHDFFMKHLVLTSK